MVASVGHAEVFWPQRHKRARDPNLRQGHLSLKLPQNPEPCKPQALHSPKPPKPLPTIARSVLRGEVAHPINQRAPRLAICGGRAFFRGLIAQNMSYASKAIRA